MMSQKTRIILNSGKQLAPRSQCQLKYPEKFSALSILKALKRTILSKMILNYLLPLPISYQRSSKNSSSRKNSSSAAKELIGLYETALATSSIQDSKSLYEKLYVQVKDLFPLDAFLIARSDSVDGTMEISFAMEEDKPMNDLIGEKFSKR